VRIRRKWRSFTIRILSSSSRRSVCDHSFADRVRSWCSGWTGENLDALSSEDPVERPGEPGIAVSEQKLDRGGPVAEVHHQVADDWSGPRPARMRGHSPQMRPARAMLDRNQGVDPGAERNTVSTCTKSMAKTALAWAVRNWRQLGPDRPGVGSRPASWRICPTGEAVIR
jgi:hypothetical protein